MSYQFVKDSINNINYIYSGVTSTPGSKAELRISSWGGNTGDILSINTLGTLLVTSISSGNINLSGNVFQNDVPIRTSQWDNGTNSIFYTVGNVGIGITSPNYKLHVAGDIYSTGDVVTFSDIRLKSNVQTITNALDKVSTMRGVYFDVNNSRKVGVIAQEIQDVLPEVVSNPGHEDSSNYLGVAYGNLVGVLIEAIKELKQSNTELKQSNTELLERVNRLEGNGNN